MCVCVCMCACMGARARARVCVCVCVCVCARLEYLVSRDKILRCRKTFIIIKTFLL